MWIRGSDFFSNERFSRHPHDMNFGEDERSQDRKIMKIPKNAKVEKSTFF